MSFFITSVELIEFDVRRFFIVSLWFLLLKSRPRNWFASYRKCINKSYFVIRSISPLPFDLDSQYKDHTLVIGNTCQSGICHLTLASLAWCVDFVHLLKCLWLGQFIYNHTLMMMGTCVPVMYNLTLTTFSWSTFHKFQMLVDL